MWEGSIREKESLLFLFVYLEAEASLRAMRPTSSDAKLIMGEGWTAVSKSKRVSNQQSKGDFEVGWGGTRRSLFF
jgi:hypothetical protein